MAKAEQVGFPIPDTHFGGGQYNLRETHRQRSVGEEYVDVIQAANPMQRQQCRDPRDRIMFHIVVLLLLFHQLGTIWKKQLDVTRTLES